MANLDLGFQAIRRQRKNRRIYNSVKRLYDNAKQLWEGVVFEVLLEPLVPDANNQPRRHIINLRHCFEEFEPNEEDEGVLELDELFARIEKLQDYKTVLETLFERVKEHFEDTHKTTLLRIINEPNPEPEIQPGQEPDSEPESESEYESDADAEAEIGSDYETDTADEVELDDDPEWDHIFDSGRESDMEQYNLSDFEDDFEYDGLEYEEYWETDSGMVTDFENDLNEGEENESEPESESEAEVEIEPEVEPELEIIQAESDSEPEDEPNDVVLWRCRGNKQRCESVEEIIDVEY